MINTPIPETDVPTIIERQHTSCRNQNVTTHYKQAFLILSEAYRKLEIDLASELGIEKAEPNAGDDPSKEYWIGVNQQCYESLRAAIKQAKGKRP